jgi:hypothetical protein
MVIVVEDCPQKDLANTRNPVCRRCECQVACTPYMATIRDRRGMTNPFLFGQSG